MLKKIYKIILITFVLFSSTAEEDIQSIVIDAENYSVRLSQLLDNYEIFMETYGRIDSDYYKAFLHFKEKLVNNETSFALDIKNSNLIDDSAGFKVSNETDDYYISIGYRLVDVYDKHPYLIYSILTHEIWHAYAYITNPEGFMMQNTDPFEKALYEIDAIHTEGLFINEVLISNNFKLTNFESYLGSCYQKNKMNDFTSPLLKVDLITLDDLYTLRNEYYINKDKGKLDSELGTIGSNLLGYYNESLDADDSWYTYKITIALHTYHQFSVILFQQTEAHEIPGRLWDDIFALYPKFYNEYKIMSEILADKQEYVEEKHRSYIEHFNKGLL